MIDYEAYCLGEHESKCYAAILASDFDKTDRAGKHRSERRAGAGRESYQRKAARSADGRQTHRCRSRATLTADDQRAYGETWVNGLQLRLMRLSRRGKRLIVADSGHDMPAERPDAIMAAVRFC